MLRNLTTLLFFLCVSLCVRPVHRTPLHCAASCNSVHLCKVLVESGAAIFASTISDVETAADKCEEMEEGFIQCSQFLYGDASFFFNIVWLGYGRV